MSDTDMSAQATATKKTGREVRHARLISYASGQGNDDALACMYVSWVNGEGALPVNWGLSPTEFTRLMAFHFPGYDVKVFRSSVNTADTVRRQEQAELIDLMKNHRAGRSDSELWMAAIVATACLGNDHLWQDLGLWSRDALSSLMQRNFPALAEKNIHNMKWKKFLYKQLCIAEGIYVCRAPSCEVCVDYQDCFGPED